VKENEMVRACSTHDDLKDAYSALVGKPEGKRPVGRPGRRWDGNIMIDLREV
jgi:hypothetical protein